MEYIILILILFIFINTVLKLSHWKWWQGVISGLVYAGFILLAYPYAITQSKTQLADYLNNTAIMQDMAVLVTFESVIYLTFCFSAMRQLYGTKPKYQMKLLHWYPGLLVFPALFYVLINAVFGLSGVDFSLIAYVLAGGIFLLLPLLSLGIKRLLPEKELRLEVQFLVSLFVAITGLTCTVNGNVIYTAMEEPLNTNALIAALGIFLFFFGTGYVWNRIKWKLKRSNK
ncbi:MAG: hypothetical protein LBJ72_09695 [Dysgonamonadaceae bacterium]|jgi:hypothetical protein|nr:hypothetical protein [Dysgonamonadaceae bacterium]